jgi:hypothetical protein
LNKFYHSIYRKKYAEMSYLPNEPTTFINIKLTDAGRQLLSLGQLTFNQGILSDREINYGIDRTGAYEIGCSNRILAPKDDAPTFSSPNSFDGSSAFPLLVGSATQKITASTESTGFFTGSTNAWGIDSGEFKGSNTISYAAGAPDGTNIIAVAGGGTGYLPASGDLMYIPWQPIQNSAVTYDSSTAILSANPTNNLWYRVLSSDSGTSEVTLDRNVPNFGGTATTTSQLINTYMYPFNGVETYYGSAATVNTRVWNMAIIRTSSVEGTNTSISGYTTYGSIQFNGTKQYLGFQDETRQIGVVHYTNEYTGNTYAEQLVEKSVVVDIPDLMWHRYPANAGQATNYGLKLQDSAGSTTFDSVAQTSYRDLRDGASTTNTIVGRVYHKLKLIVITDPELLTAITYKSNRNYTLPALSVDSSSVPKAPLDSLTSTGILDSGYTYFVTYITESDEPSSGASYGYQQALPCQYIQRIDGSVDGFGNSQYLKAFFNTSYFPYLRTSDGMTSYSGTGWNTNKVQILVNKVNTSTFPDVDLDTIPADGWRRVSSGTTGNGLFTGGTGTSTITPSDLAGFQFVISQEDWNSGSTYVLDSDFYDNNDVNTSGLTFGSESFFFGNISASILATTYKTVMTVLAPDTEYNSSSNSSYDGLLDSDTYITEVGILNNNNILVAVGKPTYPIKKNTSRYISFQLEIDF